MPPKPARRTRPLLDPLEPRQLLAAGPTLVKDIFPNSDSSNPTQFATANGYLFFAADDSFDNQQLFRSDGTAAGTVKLTNLPGQGLLPFSLTPVGNNVFFSATDDAHGRELWISDGTIAGTHIVKDIWPGSGDLGASESRPYQLTPFGGKLTFVADDGDHRDQIWISDGTDAGTTRLTNINPGNIALFDEFTVVGNTLYFAGDDGAPIDGGHGPGLWKSDGTAAGTTLIKSFNINAGGPGPLNLTNVNGTLFFDAYDDTNGYQLWKSDGTTAGTVQAATIAPDPDVNAPRPTDLTAVGDTLFFQMDDGVNGAELWKTAPNGDTAMVKDIAPGPFSSLPRSLIAYNNKLFFAATDSNNGIELFTSDGTDAGTFMLKDIATDGSGTPSSFTISNGKLYFNATDNIHGYELWQSDGTEPGTFMVADINGTSDDSIDRFTYPQMIDDRGALFFDANDGANGLELYKLGDITPTPPPLLEPGSVTGQVFHDLNANGIKDPGEPGLPNWTIHLETGQTKLVATTDSNGNYSYPAAPAGNTTVFPTIEPGFLLSFPLSGSHNFDVASSTTSPGQDFGVYQLGSISGLVFNDANGNGKKTAAEKGLKNQKVFLDLNHNGKYNAGIDKLAVTTATGAFTFTNLAPATYTLRMVIPASKRISAPKAGFFNLKITSGLAILQRLFAEAPATRTAKSRPAKSRPRS